MHSWSYNDAMSFKGLSLSETMIKALSSQGYNTPSPVQKSSIPKALRGESMMVRSETGSGKTHAFLIPIIERIDFTLPRPQALVIAPSRELARQIYEFARAFLNHFPKLRVRLFSSESDVTDNQEGQNVPPQLIIGTPGRMKDLLIDKELFTLRNVKTFVLDEADMLLEGGYFEDIEEIYAHLFSPQVLVYSATFKNNLKDELRRFMPSDAFLSESQETSSGVSHHFLDIKHVGVNEALSQFLRAKKPYLAMVFASKKETVSSIYRHLKNNGVDCVMFSGDLDERERKRALRRIREGEVPVIVASDLLSRGMDIPDVTDVISVDLPNNLEFYYHRSGRTGRFGKTGDSYVFYNADTLSRAKELYEEKRVPFSFLALRGGEIKEDPIGFKEKGQNKRKKVLPEEELTEIRIAKAKSRPKHVEPMHKKKQQFAIEKVKKKYKRKAIQKSVRKVISKQYKNMKKEA